MPTLFLCNASPWVSPGNVWPPYPPSGLRLSPPLLMHIKVIYLTSVYLQLGLRQPPPSISASPRVSPTNIFDLRFLTLASLNPSSLLIVLPMECPPCNIFNLRILTLASAHLLHLSCASLSVSPSSGMTRSTTMVVPPASAAFVPCHRMDFLWRLTTVQKDSKKENGCQRRSVGSFHQISKRGFQWGGLLRYTRMRIFLASLLNFVLFHC